jgi:Predicted acyltransferase
MLAKKFSFEFEGLDIFNDLVNKEEGFIQLSSHIGNYELAGYSLNSSKKRFNALVFEGEAVSVMKNRERVLSGNNVKMIPVKGDMSHVFLMNNALADGEILSMPGDRIFGSAKSVVCNFMGEYAKFPIGAYILAVQRGVPIVSIFVMKERVSSYKVFIKKVSFGENLNTNIASKEKIQLLANSFATNIEEILKLYPTQWFNYFEFWKQ